MPNSKNGIFSILSPDQEHQQGQGGLVFHMMVGHWKGDGQAGLCGQALIQGYIGLCRDNGKGNGTHDLGNFVGSAAQDYVGTLP